MISMVKKIIIGAITSLWVESIYPELLKKVKASVNTKLDDETLEFVNKMILNILATIKI